MRGIFIKVDVKKGRDGKWKPVCSPNPVVVKGEEVNLFWHLIATDWMFDWDPIRIHKRRDRKQSFPQDEIRLCENVVMLMDANPKIEKFPYKIYLRHKKLKKRISADPGIDNRNNVPK